MPKKLSNKLFSENDEVFKIACVMADTVPTTRQASKFRNKKGLALKFKRQAVLELAKIKEKDHGEKQFNPS